MSSTGTSPTDGRLAVHVGPLPATGGRLVHHRHDLVLVVVAGRCVVDLDGSRLPAPAGETVVVPRGTPYAVRDDGAHDPARVVVVVAPAGAEHLLTALAGPAPGRDVLVRLAAACGSQLLLDPPTT